MADNMSIDGLIKFCDEKSKNIKLKAEPQVFIEIKQALEELKIYKECNIFKTNFANGYNKAIDEFANSLIPRLTDAIYQKDVEGMTNLINDVTRELKAGVKNE